MSTSARQPSVYLDFAASTPLDPGVLKAMQDCMGPGGTFANPSSDHIEGRRAAAIVIEARERLAGLLQTASRNLIFTSGATESDNLAIQGAARFRAHRGRHIVTMVTEHKAVTDPFRHLEKNGYDVTWLQPGNDGLLDPAVLGDSLRADTQLVSVMHVNNETGVIQDIQAIGDLCRDRDVLFHTDAAQSVGKIELDLTTLPIDLLSLTAHKFYGPKGVGALYIAPRPGCGIEPLAFGGGQEYGLRPGTLPVHLIAGLGAAADSARETLQDDYAQVRKLRDRLWDGISVLPDLHRNGTWTQAYPGILNVSADGIEGESLMLALEPVCAGRGSACNAQTGESSHVLRALGLSDLRAQSAVRFSFGRMSRGEDIDQGIEAYVRAVKALRALAPARTG